MIEPLDWDALVIEAKRRRAKEKLTQQGHAALAGVSRDTIRAFDRFERSLTLEKALAILDVVGLAAGRGAAASDVHKEFVRRAVESWTRLSAQRPDGDPARFPFGHAACDYHFTGDLKPVTAATLLEILAALPSVSGWSPFHIFNMPSLRPIVEESDAGEELECWLGTPDEDKFLRDAAHSDYWRASPAGSFVVLRGYQEDGSELAEPGCFLDSILPIYRMADIVQHALLLAAEFPGRVERITFTVSWTGLKGRRLVNWADPGRASYRNISSPCRVGSLSNFLTVDLSDDSKSILRRSVANLVRPLYEAFGRFNDDVDIFDVMDERERKTPAVARLA
jgi:transcriptional regulator with XRE-family HTH domain